MHQNPKCRQANGAKKKVASSPTGEIGAFKLKGAAAYLGISPISVHRLVQRGLLKPNRALRHLLFSKAQLDEFLANGGGE
jgi:hypothetical protein